MEKDVASYTFPFFKRTRPEGRPNVVILFTDQQRYDTIQALGYPHMITPTLDRLVREGCAFVNGCTPNPVCVPARHSLMTGLYSRGHGMAGMYSVVMPPSVPRLPQLLADGGYHCELVGKMHFQPARNHNGFHRMQLQEELVRDIGDDEYHQYLQSVGFGHIRNPHGIRNPLYHHPQRSLLPEEHHPSTWVGDRAADVVRRNATRPFFLCASWIHPHPPLAVPDNFADLYRGRNIPVPTPREESPNEKLRQNRFPLDYHPPGEIQRFRELYYSAITLVDKNMAKVISALEEINQLDNTLIIMSSDHGEMLGDNGAFSKALPNDPAMRVPLILRYPRSFAAGAIRTDFASLIDILPTVLDACGIEAPRDCALPGESLLIPEGSGLKDRSVNYVENERGARRFISLRSHRYKINYLFADGREEFYDMENDPAEIHNLLAGDMSAEQRGEYEKMKARLIEYERQYGHRDSVVDSNLVVHARSAAPAWPPGQYDIDWQLAMHPFNMPEEQAARLNTHGAELLEAVRKEPIVDLKRLSWDFYESSTRDFETRKKACAGL